MIGGSFSPLEPLRTTFVPTAILIHIHIRLFVNFHFPLFVFSVSAFIGTCLGTIKVSTLLKRLWIRDFLRYLMTADRNFLLKSIFMI